MLELSVADTLKTADDKYCSPEHLTGPAQPCTEWPVTKTVSGMSQGSRHPSLSSETCLEDCVWNRQPQRVEDFTSQVGWLVDE